MEPLKRGEVLGSDKRQHHLHIGRFPVTSTEVRRYFILFTVYMALCLYFNH